MSSNRGRLTITPGGPWRLYQHQPLPGWNMLGTIQRGHEIGALARNQHTGLLCMLRAGAVSMLDQRKAEAALLAASAASDRDNGSPCPFLS